MSSVFHFICPGRKTVPDINNLSHPRFETTTDGVMAVLPQALSQRCGSVRDSVSVWFAVKKGPPSKCWLPMTPFVFRRLLRPSQRKVIYGHASRISWKCIFTHTRSSTRTHTQAYWHLVGHRGERECEKAREEKDGPCALIPLVRDRFATRSTHINSNTWHGKSLSRSVYISSTEPD